MRPHLATLVEDFQRHGSQIAVVSYPGNRRFATSYENLALLAGRFSALLIQRNIQPGDRVLLWGGNSAEWVGTFFGCVLRGVIAVPLDARGSPEFARHVVEDVTPRLAVGDAELLANLPESIARLCFDEFPQSLPRDPVLTAEASLSRDTPLQILFTSGTTSQPKGVVHTHGNVLASMDVLETEIGKYRRYERWVHPLRFLHTLPLSHVFGQFMGLWVPPLLAAEVHYDDKLAAQHLIERIHSERIWVAAVVPRVLELGRSYLLAVLPQLEQRLMDAAQESVWRRVWRFRDVHRRFGIRFWAFVCGGATLQDELETFWNTLGFAVVQGYGMTETTALATLNHPFHPTPGSIGKALAGREVKLNEEGEILVRGPMLAAGTWRDGRMVPRQGEWLATGDLATADAEGKMRFLGRKGDVIVSSSGMNIHPGDLEAALRDQTGVRDCVVVAWSGPQGPEPVAVVILKQDPANAGDDRSQMDTALGAANLRLREFQQVRRILRWPYEDFPRNSLGKLLRREVVAWVQTRLDTQRDASGFESDGISDPLLRVIQQVTRHTAMRTDDAADLSTDFYLDSLGRMQLAAAIEDQFGTGIEDEALTSARTLGDLRHLVARPSAAESTGERRDGIRPSGGEELAAIGERTSEGVSGRSPVSVNLPAPIYARRPAYPHWPWRFPVPFIRTVFVEGIMRPLTALLANPQVTSGPQRLPREPAIYVANHVTAVDVPLVLYALPGRIRRHMAVAMSAELLAAWRKSRPNAAGVGAGPLRWLAPLQALAVTALFNVFPLPSGRGLRQSFAHAGEALDRGFNVLIFPEGRRTTDGRLQPFQTGISLLAHESHTKIVPVALHGLGGENRRAATVRVTVGTPIRPNPGETHPEFAERLHGEVERLLAQPAI